MQRRNSRRLDARFLLGGSLPRAKCQSLKLSSTQFSHTVGAWKFYFIAPWWRCAVACVGSAGPHCSSWLSWGFTARGRARQMRRGGCVQPTALVICASFAVVLGGASGTLSAATESLAAAWLAGAADGAAAGGVPLATDWRGRFYAARAAVGAALTTLRTENASVSQSPGEQLRDVESLFRVWDSLDARVDGGRNLAQRSHVVGLVLAPSKSDGAAFSAWVGSSTPVTVSPVAVGHVSVQLGSASPCVADLHAVSGSSRNAALYRLPVECLSRNGGAGSTAGPVDVRIAVYLRARRGELQNSFNTEMLLVHALPSRVRLPSFGAVLERRSLPPVVVTATSVCGVTTVGVTESPTASSATAAAAAEPWGSFGGSGLADFHFVRLVRLASSASGSSSSVSGSSVEADLQLPLATEAEAKVLMMSAARAAASAAAQESSGAVDWARWLLAGVWHGLAHFPDAVMRWQAQAQSRSDAAAAPEGSDAAPRAWAHVLAPLVRSQSHEQSQPQWRADAAAPAQVDGGGGSWGWPYAEPAVAAWIAAREPVSHVLSGTGGRFCFHGVPPGSYHLMLAPGHAEVQSLGLAPAPLALAVSIGISGSGRPTTAAEEASADTLAMAPISGIALTLKRPKVSGKLAISASAAAAASTAAAESLASEAGELALMLALAPTGHATDWVTTVAPVRVPVAAGCRVAIVSLPRSQASTLPLALADEVAIEVEGAWHGAFSAHARLVAARTLTTAKSGESTSRSWKLPTTVSCTEVLALLPAARIRGAAESVQTATEPAALEKQLAAAGFVPTRTITTGSPLLLPAAVQITDAAFGTADASALAAALSADIDAVKAEAAATAAAASIKASAAVSSRQQPLQLLSPLAAAMTHLSLNGVATALLLLLTSAAMCFPAQATVAVSWAKQLVGLQPRSVISEDGRSVPQRRSKVSQKSAR